MDDVTFMGMALEEARAALAEGEVPVGAVVVRGGEVIGRGRNSPIGHHDPSAHAEILALREAGQACGNYRLDDCELFVTLEPCSMCSGAVLHARLKRVVFGAHDPKTGAAGSQFNLFSNRQLNHHTQVLGGVMSAQCSGLLQRFFKFKREAGRARSVPVREDALRTADILFQGLSGYPWPPSYASDLPSLKGLRMHFLDVGSRASSLTYLCLHGNPAWSYLFRKMIPVFLAAGSRVVAPDLIGFGKSDKPKKEAFHSFSWHRQSLLELIEHLELKNIVLVVQDWGGLLGLTLPLVDETRYCGLLVMNTIVANGEVPMSPGFFGWRDMCARSQNFDIARLLARDNPQMSVQECAAYAAPFPDRGHSAAVRAFSTMLPDVQDSDGVAISHQAREFWRERWSGKTLIAVGTQDSVLGTPPVMHDFQKLIRGCPPPLMLQQAGHFFPEHGEAIARQAVHYFSDSIPTLGNS